MLTSRLDLAELDLHELEAALDARGCEKFHARQLYRWIYKRGVTDFDRMTDLSRTLRAQLTEEFTLATPQVVADDRSVDGTRKFVLELADARRIEAVFIPDTPSMTFCISTQVGCAMGCDFCLTGKMGLVRHLTAGEIAGQVRVLADATGMLDSPLQHRPDGDGRAAAQLRQHDEGAADAPRGAWPRRLAAPRDAVDGRHRSRSRAPRHASR